MIVQSPHRTTSTGETKAADVAPQPRLSQVRGDLIAIFGDADDRPLPPARLVPPLRTTGPAEPALGRGGARRRAIGPILCAASAGLLAGMAIVGAPRLIGSGTSPAPTLAAAETVVESPFENLPARPAAPAAASERHAASEQTRAAPPAPRVTEAVKPVQTAVDSDPPNRARRSEEARASADSSVDSTGCQGDRLERHWCMRDDILEADRALRLAYANAIKEGVERRFLVAHQRRWTRLRDRATRDPDAVLAGYRELADDLERLAVNGRRRDRIS